MKKMLWIMLGLLLVMPTMIKSNNEAPDTGCLLKHIDCLCSCHAKNIVMADIYFKHPLVLECVEKIEKEQSFKPLRETCKAVQQLKNEAVIREFTALLIISYTVALNSLTHKTKNIALLLSLVSLYSQLNSLPLAKLFDILEECWKQYQAIMANFPKEEDASWSTWGQDYWWVPVAVISFTLMQFMRWYQAVKSKPVK